MKLLMRCVLALLLFALACFNASANEIYKIDPAHSRIAFSVRHMLGTAKGTFSKFHGTIELDKDNPERSSVAVTIQAASIDTAIAKRDEHLRSEEFFHVRKFPEITFTSRTVKQDSARSGQISGDLTMHGVSRLVTLRAQLLADPTNNQRMRWRATTTSIKRSEFGLVWSKSVEAISMIGDTVSIDLEIEATRPD